MCGIFGFYLNRQISENEIYEAKKNLNLLSHRGPDFSNYFLDKENGIFLGHTRLSIIDLSNKNNQPFIKNNKKLAYNGEIYNYKELTNKYLDKDIKFITKGDTEVLFEILSLNDFNKLSLIDGMFAFAFLNKKNLYLGRDIYGEKPLYFYQNKSGIFFASEQKPIINYCKLRKTFNIDANNEFINFGYNFKNKFYDISEVKAGNILHINNGKIIDDKNFDKIPSIKNKNNFRNFKEFDINSVKNMLVESISNRLNSDVPLGLLLSSGNDSSLVAAIMKKELNYNFETVTYSFSNKKYDETNFVKKFCKNLNITNHLVNKDVNNSSNIYKEAINLFDIPNDSITGINVFNICKEMKKYFKVGLTGMGGDEIFYGYYKHRFIYKYQKILTNDFLKRMIRFFNFTNFKYIQKFNSYNYPNDLEIILSLKNNPYFNNKIIKNHFEFKEYKSLFRNTNDDLFTFFNFFDLNYDLKYSIIPGIERGSMRASTELRTPYLNKKLHNYILQFNYKDIMSKGQKWIQKEILSKYIPEDLINHTKMGFINPPISKLKNSGETDIDHKIKYAFQNIQKDNRWDRFILRSKIIEEFTK